MLFDPGTGFEPWYHFRLSAGNVQSDQRNSSAEGYNKRGWNIPWRSATRITDRGWQAEIALPFCTTQTVYLPLLLRAHLKIKRD